MSETPVRQQSTAAFYGQVVASFAVAMAATAIGSSPGLAAQRGQARGGC